MRLPRLALLCTLAAFAHAPAKATITINIFAGELRGADGNTPVAQGTLLQLINLGGDGVFNPINLGDGDASQAGQWISGDDSLLNVAYLVGSNPGDFASAAAFDLNVGADPATGVMDRSFRFQIGDLPEGTKLGLRWFPTLQAADFSTASLAIGQNYGQFTRQSNPQHGGVIWVTGADGNTLNFDALASTAIGGVDANAAAAATLTVIPEPAAIGLSLLGAAGLGMLRRRRA